MEEKLIEFETAKLATEKGFNVNCLHFYTKPNSKMFGIDEHNRTYTIKNTTKKLYKCGEEAALNIESVYLAPTQSLLQKWLREIHKINVYCSPCEHDESLWYNNIASQTPVFTGTYEEALEIGLQEGLKLI